MSRRALAAVVSLACIAPFAYLALLSLAGPWPFPHLLPETLRGDRWRALAEGGGALGDSLLTSLVVSGVVALLASAGGFLSARAVAYHRWRAWLLAAAYVPFAASPVVLGVCLLYVYIKLGVAGTALGVVLAHTVFAYGFAVLFWVPFWSPEKRGYEDLVRTLGGSHLQAFRRVLLPLSRGPFAVCVLQTFLISWFQYGLTVLVGAGKVDTLTLRVFAYVYEGNTGQAAVASLVLIAPAAAFAWLNRRVISRLVGS
jgi:putative spermidine/putrescine transport system permease protein